MLYIHFLLKNNKKMSTIFVFDFDQTLIMGHTGGLPTMGCEYETDNSLIIKLCNMLKLLQDKNISIYINTRGVIKEVTDYLRFRFQLVKENFDTLIQGIFGADNEEQISNPYLSTLEFWYANNIVCSKLENAKLQDASTRVWAYQKTNFLIKIAEQQQIPKEYVYFFYDSSINIEYAKTCGFVNSFVIRDDSLVDQPFFLKHTLELVPSLLSGLLINIRNT
jgi:hypothetical protein